MKFSWVKTAVIVIASLILMIAVLLLAWKKHIINYTETKGQLLQGSYADSIAVYDGTLRMVTWNLHFGEKLDEVIATLENTSELQEADLLLLQEIDAEGVEKITRSLGFNYSFFPTVFSRQRGKEYGIAILSKWPLKETDKILLPNWFPGWVENRYAIKAVTTINGRDITVYNVHLDVVWMEPQGEFLAKEIEKEKIPVIFGGDFNTWRPGSISFLENKLKEAGLERLTKGTGYTFESNGLKFTLDHIFSMEGLDYSAGVHRQTDASDHYPVWVKIKLDFGE